MQSDLGLWVKIWSVYTQAGASGMRGEVLFRATTSEILSSTGDRQSRSGGLADGSPPAPTAAARRAARPTLVCCYSC